MKKTFLALLCATSMLSGVAVSYAAEEGDMLPPPPPPAEDVLPPHDAPLPPKDAPRPDVEAAALAVENVKRQLEGKEIKKIIVVPNKICNIVA